MPATLLARPASAARSPVSEIREAVVKQIDDPNTYPTLSDTAVKAMAVVNGWDTSMTELAAVIRPDAFVTAAVLRTANTFKYRGRTAVEFVPQAVLRIGVKECARLISSIGMHSLYHSMPPAARKGCEMLHRHSVFVACLAARMDKTFGLGCQGTAFTAGLLHDIGRIVLCAKMPERLRAIGGLEFLEDRELLAREREAFGIDHAAIGFQFATKHQLPEPVIRAAFNHHRAGDERFHPALVALIGTADRIANHVQREHELKTLEVEADEAFNVMAWGWDSDRIAGFHKNLPEVVVAAIRETRGMIKSAG